MGSDLKGRQGTAILSLTRQAGELSQKLALALGEATVYMPRRLENQTIMSEVQYFEEWETAFREAFNRHSRLICIMAAGIVVRSLAPLLTSKYTDPAVVVVDEKGQYAISLLSGHLGGANQLAGEVAELLGGQAVITTATDVQGKNAADLLALDLNAVIEPMENLKIINRSLAEERTVYLYSPWPVVSQVQLGFCWQGWPQKTSAGSKELSLNQQLYQADFLQPAVIISYHARLASDPGACLLIKPRNLALGIGCRRGVAYHELQEAVYEVIEQFNVDKRCLRSIASIDRKADEAAIGQLATELQIPFVTYSAEEISSFNGTYQESAWVKEKVGVGGVCEPAARLAAHSGITIVPKQKIGPITISIAMEKSWWWDWALVAGSI